MKDSPIGWDDIDNGMLAVELINVARIMVAHSFHMTCLNV